MTLPAHTFAVKTQESGATVPDGAEGNEYLEEVQYSADFSYFIDFSAETKAADSGGSGGSGGGGSGGSGGSTPPTPAQPVTVFPTSISASSTAKGVKVTAIQPGRIKITGSYRTAFDDSYQFVRKNGELVILPSDTAEIDIALVKYTMPSQSRQLFEYTVTLEWPIGSAWEGLPTPTEVIIRQYARWSTAIAAENIAKLKDWR